MLKGIFDGTSSHPRTPSHPRTFSHQADSQTYRFEQLTFPLRAMNAQQYNTYAYQYAQPNANTGPTPTPYGQTMVTGNEQHLVPQVQAVSQASNTTTTTTTTHQQMVSSSPQYLSQPPAATQYQGQAQSAFTSQAQQYQGNIIQSPQTRLGANMGCSLQAAPQLTQSQVIDFSSLMMATPKQDPPPKHDLTGLQQAPTPVATSLNTTATSTRFKKYPGAYPPVTASRGSANTAAKVAKSIEVNPPVTKSRDKTTTAAKTKKHSKTNTPVTTSHNNTTTTKTTKVEKYPGANAGGKAREAAEAKGEKELQRFEKKVQTLIRTMGVCPMQIRWYNTHEGYLCGAGTHFIDHRDIDMAFERPGRLPQVTIVNRFDDPESRMSGLSRPVHPPPVDYFQDMHQVHRMFILQSRMMGAGATTSQQTGKGVSGCHAAGCLNGMKNQGMAEMDRDLRSRGFIPEASRHTWFGSHSCLQEGKPAIQRASTLDSVRVEFDVAFITLDGRGFRNERCFYSSHGHRKPLFLLLGLSVNLKYFSKVPYHLSQ